MTPFSTRVLTGSQIMLMQRLIPLKRSRDGAYATLSQGLRVMYFRSADNSIIHIWWDAETAQLHHVTGPR